jgi:hypothetical protein
MNAPWRSLSVLFSVSLLGCQNPASAPSSDSLEVEVEVAAGSEEAKPRASTGAQLVLAQADDKEGCIHGKADHEGCVGEIAPATGAGHFGSPFAGTSPVALGAAVESMTKSPSPDAVLVTGEVSSVCQAKGCWMVLRDVEKLEVEARVIMKNHAFAVPFDGKGKKASVEGVLTSRTFTAAQVKHLAKDAGADPAAVEAKPRTEWVLTATGVELTG